ncbi:hypothetical protein K490DRAFT_46782 [Saccharata proteae CBS 121410]|uniref:N-acetyltransferase domain-containing protein n=1 Tax=Saccharata proteae CBS 121410 TaxID=1314787 RepID=A0A9P4HRL6_9PEZI|nr:hypothetical protein K490DRAFT_46782 [Saccharata proteae CBS 121410]
MTNPQSTASRHISTAAGLTSRPTTIHHSRLIQGRHFFISDDQSLISIPFVNQAFSSEAMHWAQPFDVETTKTLLRNSTTLGLYAVLDSGTDEGQANLRHKKIGLARFITDTVTFAYLTDVFVSPDFRGLGLGKWLVECCGKFVDGMVGLRQTMLLTSRMELARVMYGEGMGMEVLKQGEGGLWVMKKGKGRVGR